jgi:hypothetical protein
VVIAAFQLQSSSSRKAVVVVVAMKLNLRALVVPNRCTHIDEDAQACAASARISKSGTGAANKVFVMVVVTAALTLMRMVKHASHQREQQEWCKQVR